MLPFCKDRPPPECRTCIINEAEKLAGAEQRTIGYATPTSSADRPLLHLRHLAYKNSETLPAPSALVRSHALLESGKNDKGVMAKFSIQKGCQASCSGVRHQRTAPPTMPSLKH
jgi:hypothetical protein